MIYERLPPCPALRALVKEYMLFHLRYDHNQPKFVNVLPPLTENGLEFLPMVSATFINHLTGEV